MSPHRFTLRLVLVLAATGFAGAREAAPPPDPTEAKIRLLSDALRARDGGDLALARAKLEALRQLAPGDATVRRLLATLGQPAETKVTVSGGLAAPLADEAEQLAQAEAARIARALADAREGLGVARGLAAERQFDAALERLAQARRALPANPTTQPVLAELEAAAAEIVRARDAPETGIVAGAGRKEANEKTSAPAVTAVTAISAPEERPAAAATVPSAPAELRALIARGRSQYLAGDPSAAAQTFARVLELEPGNADAGRFLARIANDTVDRNVDRAQTSAQLLNEVARAWQRPGVQPDAPLGAAAGEGPSPLLAKLNRIVLPEVSFSGMELGRVMTFLGAAAAEYDEPGASPRGVNIVLLDPAGANPPVNHVTLRGLSLRRVLDLVTQSVGYQYEVQADAVVVRPGGEQTTLDTQFFPVSRSTVLRLTGRGAEAAAGTTADPLAGGARSAAPAPGFAGEGQAIRSFLQLAGVSFEGTPGSTLAFDGSQLIVTQTARNLERIRNILARYRSVRQVEIEAKFMEVQDGALEELGVNWSLGKKATQHSGASVTNYATSNRALSDAFSTSSAGTRGAIVRPAVDPIQTTTTDADGNTTAAVTTPGSDALNLPIVNNPPPIPGTNNLGLGASPLAAVTGILGEFNVSAVLRALSQRSGTELLSAPKLTVLSGNPATITVAQELRYPQSYGQVQSQVGTGSASGGGSAGVTITAGTPQEFTTRNIGVELRVTPTVEEDDTSISLDLNPKVTEFEGFVEYGGQSVAVSGSTTVTVPSGFYQPIFAVRELSTKVTIWDGATLVMGGLTREDTRKTNDKVPLIGNLPVLGRLFRSRGESAQKRNLLIFVTANLVSPGGALKKQGVRGAPAGSIFRNPTIVTPAGATGREERR
ncbi:type II secretory pathway, component PulD [Oleiharenicola sp. Vm1]|uniref:type II secretory pathway, component PulD n=1 Tax=Oleiharenicola sp. Vm1 TaxID=3398393 RepID=UPI0039F51E39